MQGICIHVRSSSQHRYVLGCFQQMASFGCVQGKPKGTHPTSRVPRFLDTLMIASAIPSTPLLNTKNTLNPWFMYPKGPLGRHFPAQATNPLPAGQKPSCTPSHPRWGNRLGSAHQLIVAAATSYICITNMYVHRKPHHHEIACMCIDRYTCACMQACICASMHAFVQACMHSVCVCMHAYMMNSCL